MTKEEKIKRGKEILKQYKFICQQHNPDKYPSTGYCEDILHAISIYTYDTPIPEKDMCIALADAEMQGKSVFVEPNEEENLGMCDGWTYHIEIR